MTKMQSLHENWNPFVHDAFLRRIAKHLTYIPESANFDFYLAFIDLISCDGGDDDFAEYSSAFVAFQFSKHVTLEHIERYDLSDENTDSDMFLSVYHEIKPNINL